MYVVRARVYVCACVCARAHRYVSVARARVRTLLGLGAMPTTIERGHAVPILIPGHVGVVHVR